MPDPSNATAEPRDRELTSSDAQTIGNDIGATIGEVYEMADHGTSTSVARRRRLALIRLAALIYASSQP